MYCLLFHLLDRESSRVEGTLIKISSSSIGAQWKGSALVFLLKHVHGENRQGEKIVVEVALQHN